MSSGPTNGNGRDVTGAPPQPTVMLTGGDGPRLRSVAAALFGERAGAGDGAVVVTTTTPPADLLASLTRNGHALDASKVAVVDLRAEAEPAVDAGYSTGVAADADAPTVDDAVSSALSGLADDGLGRRHVLYDTLATGGDVVDEATAYDRAYEVAMTVGAEDGLALFTLDDTGVEGEAVEELAHLFDVHVELRTAGDGVELRWTGLLGASDGWVSLEDLDLATGAFR